MANFVSVLMPVYNGGSLLADAIESILKQTFRNFELIIVNDGSTDTSASVIQSYQDSRIKFINLDSNSGLVAALNTGLKHATGKYIARMDQDDIAMPFRFKEQYDYMENHPGCVLLGTQVKVLGGNKQSQMYTNNEELKASLIFGSSFAHPTVMIRAAVLQKNQIAYEERFKHAEDYGLWATLAGYGTIANLNKVCLEYRKHESQYTKVFSDGMLRATRLIRNIYLENLKASFTKNEMDMLNSVAEKKVNFQDKEELKKIGRFLSTLAGRISTVPTQSKAVKKIAHIQWKQLCGERQKNGFNSYDVFLSSGKSTILYDFKTHLWFLRELFRPKLKVK